MIGIGKKDTLIGYLFLSPAVLLMTVFLILPILFSFVMSFCATRLTETGSLITFVGLRHYMREMTSVQFWESFLYTAYFTVGVTFFGVVLSLIIAVMLNARIPFVKVFRNLFFMPVVLSTVVVALMWLQIFASTGLVNKLLETLKLPVVNWLGDGRGMIIVVLTYFEFIPGIGKTLASFGANLPRWMGGPSLALTSIMIISIWKNLGYGMILFLAAMQTIPTSVYEAADIDGVGPMGKFFYITVPLLTPTIFFLILISIINSFQVFDLVYMITGGAFQTNVAIFRVFKMFKSLDSPEIVYAATFILFFILIIITVIQFRFEKQVHYE